MLRKNGYAVTEAENGQEALDTLAGNDFSVVLMDLRMPVMSGNEAIKEIRRNESTRDLPVIALSAGVLQHEIDEALANGFDHYVTKPVDFEKLLLLLSTVAETPNQRPEQIKIAPRMTASSLTKSQEPKPAPMQTQAAEQIADKVLEKSQTPELAVVEVDFDLALANHDGDRHLLNRLLADFIEFYSDSPQQLFAALSEHRYEAAVRLMHNLGSLSGTFGAESLMRVCRKHEKAIEDEQNLGRQEQAEFERLVAAFVGAIRQYLNDDQQIAGSS